MKSALNKYSYKFSTSLTVQDAYLQYIMYYNVGSLSLITNAVHSPTVRVIFVLQEL